ncbi:carbon storage regulator [Halorhodospira halophila]|uniref:carbon storage regulator n=1 Tax=Halorhodospira halophila TaxID=1053 RepID=UPI001A924D42|nr:carbon storage regulator [Halorhodospira halophila]MBK5935892.1 hypothetical protein [Halorhodospira halophila]
MDRRVGERLLIGEEIDLKPGWVWLGIEVPQVVVIRRAELIEQCNARESRGESQE